jgi:capsular polysaccharide biosynthesis protein
MSTANSNSDFDSTNLVAFIYKWRKVLLIVAAATAVISAIVSYTITPKYKSTVIMFPAQTNSISKALLNDNAVGHEDILSFGEEEESEQMLQILNSDNIRSRICEKFDLLKHYNVDENDKYKYTNLFKEYDSNISFERTEFLSVKVTVMDKDPQMAADIANEIAMLLDTTKTSMQRTRAKAGLVIVEQQYFGMKAEIKAMNDSLKVLRSLGINDYETQSQAFNEQYAMALAKGNEKGAKQLEEKMEVLSKYGGAYVTLREELENQLKQLTILKTKYEEAKVDATQNLASKFIVNNAYKAEKKAYPIRWLIVTVSTLASILFSILSIIVIDNFRRIQQ